MCNPQTPLPVRTSDPASSAATPKKKPSEINRGLVRTEFLQIPVHRTSNNPNLILRAAVVPVAFGNRLFEIRNVLHY
jgi:hypothetical protein